MELKIQKGIWKSYRNGPKIGKTHMAAHWKPWKAQIILLIIKKGG